MSVDGFDASTVTAESTNQLIQVCNMQIVFSAESDAMAIAVKRRIEDATRDVPKLRMTFQLAYLPKRGEIA